MDFKPGKYRHYKGGEYELIGLAKHSETLEEMIIYRALYGNRAVWVRPSSMWFELVETDNYSGPRFCWISPMEQES